MISLFEVILPTGRLSLACHASCGGSQPWGPATAHHTLLEVIHQKLRTDLAEGLACLADGQPIGGDQDHGHSTEMWELGWSNPGQDCSMDHGRVGHSCNGLIH